MRPVLFAICLSVAPGLVQAEDAKVTVTKRDCARLVRHQPSADVAYQPGIGVGGRKVAPADLDGGQGASFLPEVLEFTIAINPIGWAERNSAMKDKAAAEAAEVASYRAAQAAQTQLTSLQATETKLTEAGTTLTTQQGTLQDSVDDLEADIAAYDAQIAGGTLSRFDDDYLRAKRNLTSAQAALAAKNTEIAANTKALTDNAEAQTKQQSIIDAAPDDQKAAGIDALEAQSTLSSWSSRGLDNTSMTVGTVRYDTLKGTFTMNGQPLGAAEQGALAEACAKMGVR